MPSSLSNCNKLENGLFKLESLSSRIICRLAQEKSLSVLYAKIIDPKKLLHLTKYLVDQKICFKKHALMDAFIAFTPPQPHFYFPQWL